MIGKLLATASVVEEDRVLCTAMRKGSYWKHGTSGPCLVGTMLDVKQQSHIDRTRFGSAFVSGAGNIETRYDCLCKRYGTERINTLIRNRILDNRVRKALKGVRSNEQAAAVECD